MNSEILERLKNLYTMLLVDDDDADAVVNAVSEALSLLEEAGDYNLTEIFPQTAEDKGLRLFLSLIYEAWGDSTSTMRETVVNRLAQHRAFLAKSEFDGAFSDYFPEGEYSVDDHEITITASVTLSYDGLYGIDKFINNYVPCNCRVLFDGTGLLWSDINSAGILWCEIDKLTLPFYTLETLEGSDSSDSSE